MPVYTSYSSAFSGQSSRILRVGRGLHCPFKHISDAITASQPYDRIEIESGEYYETISISHPLELASTNDDEAPCINARGPCITVNEKGPVLIENLRVRAKGSKPSDSMAILVVHGAPVVRGCELSAVRVINESCPTITHCKIQRADRGCGLIISDDAGGEYMHNDIAFHPEECIRIQSTGQPNLHNNRILQINQCRAVVMIAGGKFAAACQPMFCDNIISGNGEVSLDESPDPAVLLTHAQLTAPDIHSAECLVHVSWGAKPVLKGNYACNGIHGFLFGGTVMPSANFNGNRIANCTGWAIAVGDGTGLAMHGCEIQQCAGAVRVFNNLSNHFGKLPTEGARAIQVVSHTATREQHRRASLPTLLASQCTTPTVAGAGDPATPSAHKQLRKAVDEKDDMLSAEAMRAFRKDIVTALKRDAAVTNRFHTTGRLQRNSSRRSSARPSPEKVASAQCLSRSTSFRLDARKEDATTTAAAASLSLLRNAREARDNPSEQGTSPFTPQRVRGGAPTGAHRKDVPRGTKAEAGDSHSARAAHGVSIVMSRCTFRRNFHFGVYIENSLVNIAQCRFVENMVGLVLSRNCTLCSIVKNEFEGNVHAGVLCINSAEATLESNTITGAATPSTAAFLTANGLLPMPAHGVGARNGASTSSTAPRLVTTSAGLVSSLRLHGAHRDKGNGTTVVTSTSFIASTSAAGSMTSAHGILLQSHASITLLRNRITTHVRNVTVSEGSALVASFNQLQHGRLSQVFVSDNSHVDLQENTLNESGSGAVVLVHESHGRLCKNQFHSCTGEGIALSNRSHVDAYENVLHACQVGFSVRRGSSLYAERNTATLGAVGIAVRDDRSEMTIVDGRFLTTTESFGIVEGAGGLLTVRGTQFESCLGRGFVLSQQATVHFEKCQLTDCKESFVDVAPPRENLSTGTAHGSLHLTQCKLIGSKGAGIHIRAAAADRGHHLAAVPEHRNSLFPFTLSQCLVSHCEGTGVCVANDKVTCDITHNKVIGCLGAALDLNCAGTVTHCEVDGWNPEEITNGLVGIRLGGEGCCVEVHSNKFTDCVIGAAVEAAASPVFYENAIVSPVDAGVLVTGPAPHAVVRDITIERSDGAGIVVKDGALASLKRCTITDAMVASVVVGRGPTLTTETDASEASRGQREEPMFTDCTLASAACEVLVDANYRLETESNVARRPLLYGLVHLDPAAVGTTARTEGVTDMRSRAPVRLESCRMGGPQTRQCVVAVRGTVALVKCTLTTGHPVQGPHGVGKVDGAALDDRRPEQFDPPEKKRRARIPSDALGEQTRRIDSHSPDRPSSRHAPSTSQGHGKDSAVRALVGVRLAASLSPGLGVVAHSSEASVQVSGCTIGRCAVAGVQAESTATCHLEESVITSCATGVQCTAAAVRSTQGMALGECADALEITPENIMLRRLTLRDCPSVGVECAAGSVCHITECRVERCGVALAIAERARVVCQASLLAHAHSHGVSIVGQPHSGTRVEGAYINSCGGFGISHTALASGNSVCAEDPVMTAVTTMEAPTLRGCEVRCCTRGSAWLEGQLNVVECFFHAQPAARKPQGLLSHLQLDIFESDEEDDFTDSRPSSTSLVIHGKRAYVHFHRSRFLMSSATKAQVVASVASTVRLTECSLDGGDADATVDGGGRLLAVLHARYVALETCGFEHCRSAIVYAPPPTHLLQSHMAAAPLKTLEEAEGSPLPTASAGCDTAFVMKSPLSTTTTETEAGAQERWPHRQLQHDQHREPATQIHLVACKIDVSNAKEKQAACAFQSETNTFEWDVGESGAGAAVPVEDDAAQRAVTTRRLGFTLSCLRCAFTGAMAGAAEAGGPHSEPCGLVALGRFCRAAAFHSCTFTAAPLALALKPSLPRVSEVDVCHCTFSSNLQGVKVLAGGVTTLSHCHFTQQSGHDVVIHGGHAVQVRDCYFERCTDPLGSVLVQCTWAHALARFQRFAGDRWSMESATKQRELVRAWLAKEEARKNRGGVATRDWALERNTFAGAKTGVAILVPSRYATEPLATVCLPDSVRLTDNVFERCGTGMLAETAVESEDKTADDEEASAQRRPSQIKRDKMKHVLVRELGNRDITLLTSVQRNTYIMNRTGCVLAAASSALEVRVSRNTFSQNDGNGLRVCCGASPVVTENTFLHHDGDGNPTGAPLEETATTHTQDTTALELSEEVLRNGHDATAAVCVLPGGGGRFVRNVFRENLVAMSFTDVAHVITSDCVFNGNDRAIRIAADNGAPTTGASPTSLNVISNTFLGSILCDVHTSAFTNIPEDSGAVAKGSSARTENTVLLAFNRFLSAQVPVSLFAHDFDSGNTNYKGAFRVYNNVFTANAQCAVRLARCTTLDIALASNLFFGVGFGVVVGPESRQVFLADNYFAQHAAAALSVASGSALTIHGCWFVCYPDHVTLVANHSAQVSLTGCRFYSAHRLAGSPDPCLVFADQCKKVLVSQCAFVGKQSAILVEGRSTVAVSQTLFKGNESGLTIRSGGSAHVDPTCLFTQNRFSGVRLWQGSRGDITLLNGHQIDNTVLAMGEHEVELHVVEKVTGPLAPIAARAAAMHKQPDPFGPNLDTCGVVDLEERLLGYFVHVCLARDHVPLWVREKMSDVSSSKAAGEGDTAEAPSGLLSRLVAAHRAMVAVQGEAGAEGSEDAEGGEHRTKDAVPQADASSSPPATTSAARPSNAAALTVAEDGDKKSRRPPKKDPNVALTETILQNAEALLAALAETANTITSLSVDCVNNEEGDDAESVTGEDNDSARSHHPVALCLECQTTADVPRRLPSQANAPVSTSESISVLDVVDKILGTVVQRSEAQRLDKATRAVGATQSRGQERKLSLGNEGTPANAGDGFPMVLPHMLDATVGPSRSAGRSTEDTFRIQPDGSPSREDMRSERSLRRSHIATEEAQRRNVWDPYFARTRNAVPNDESFAEGDTHTFSLGRQGRLGKNAAQQSLGDRHRSVAQPRGSETPLRRVKQYYPIKSERLCYTVCPVTRMPPRHKSLQAYALERRRRERANRRARRTRASPVLTLDDDGVLRRTTVCRSYGCEEGLEVDMDASFSALFPSYRRERVLLTSDIGFHLFYNEFCLFAEEEEAPHAPVLRAYEEEEPVAAEGAELSQSGQRQRASEKERSTAWTRFWEEEDQRRAQDARFRGSLAGSPHTGRTHSSRRSSTAVSIPPPQSTLVPEGDSEASMAPSAVSAHHNSEVREEEGATRAQPPSTKVEPKAHARKRAGTRDADKESSAPSKKPRKAKRGTSVKSKTKKTTKKKASAPSDNAAAIEHPLVSTASNHVVGRETVAESVAPPASPPILLTKASFHGQTEKPPSTNPVKLPPSITERSHDKNPLLPSTGTTSSGFTLVQLQLVHPESPLGRDRDTQSPLNRKDVSSEAAFARSGVLGRSATSSLLGSTASGPHVVTTMQRVRGDSTRTSTRGNSGHNSPRSSGAAVPSVTPSSNRSASASAALPRAGSGDKENVSDSNKSEDSTVPMDTVREGPVAVASASSRSLVASTHLGSSSTSSGRPPRWRRDSTAEADDDGVTALSLDEEVRQRKRRETKTTVPALGKSGLPVTAASSLRPPLGRPAPRPRAESEVVASLTEAPELHSDGSQTLWDAVSYLVCKSDPSFRKHTESAASRSGTTRPSSRLPSELPSVRSVLSAEEARPSSRNSDAGSLVQEADDILALLHWLAERRRFMDPETYTSAFDTVMRGTANMRPFTARRVPHNAEATLDNPFNAADSGECTVYIPLVEDDVKHVGSNGAGQSLLNDAATTEEAPAGGTWRVRCIRACVVPGRGILAVSVVELPLEDIPPHPSGDDISASFHKARCRMARELQAAHPDVMADAQSIYGQRERSLSATAALIAAGLTRRASRLVAARAVAEDCAGDASPRAGNSLPGASNAALQHALPLLPGTQHNLTNPFRFPSVVTPTPTPADALSYEELQRRLLGQASTPVRQRGDPLLFSRGSPAPSHHHQQQPHLKHEKTRGQKARPHRVGAMHGPAAHATGTTAPPPEKSMVVFDPAKPAATTPFNVAAEQPYAFRQGFLSTR